MIFCRSRLCIFPLASSGFDFSRISWISCREDFNTISTLDCCSGVRLSPSVNRSTVIPLPRCAPGPLSTAASLFCNPPFFFSTPLPMDAFADAGRYRNAAFGIFNTLSLWAIMTETLAVMPGFSFNSLLSTSITTS